MACKRFLEWLLRILNFLLPLVVVGLAMVGYGLYGNGGGFGKFFFTYTVLYFLISIFTGA